MTVTDFLRQRVPILADLPEETARALARSIDQKVFQKGQTVVFKGTTVEGLHIVASGRVRVEKKPARAKGQSPRPGYAAELGPGEVFGEMSLLERGTACASVKVLEDDTLIFLIPEEQFRGLVAEHPQVEDRAWGVVIERRVAERTAEKAAAAPASR